MMQRSSVMRTRRRVPLVLALVALACVLVADFGAAASACPAPPAAIRDLDMARPYSDAVGSVASDEVKARHAAEAQPLKEFLTHVTRDADHPEAAACALQWLAAWAEGGALLGAMRSKQAEYERKWNLAGFALAYLEVRRAASPQQRAVVEPWLKSLAVASLRFFDDASHKRNNHWYWLGLGLGATALATNDDALWSKAHAIYRDALADIAADGTLPHELTRATRALHYHDFAVMPLVVLAELAAARGEDWYGERGGALHRLVDVVLAGFADPSSIERKSGVAQERPLKLGAGWPLLYVARHGARLDPAARAAASAARPTHRWLGGDVRGLLRR